MEKKNYRAEIVNAIKNYFDMEEWKYRFDEERSLFDTTLIVKHKLKSIDFKIIARDTSFLTLASIEITADDETVAPLSEFFTRANFGLNDGCFQMHYDKGLIQFRIFHNCTDGIPSSEVIQRSIVLCAQMFKRYGDGILKVMFGIQSPKEAIEMCESNNE